MKQYLILVLLFLQCEIVINDPLEIPAFSEFCEDSSYEKVIDNKNMLTEKVTYKIINKCIKYLYIIVLKKDHCIRYTSDTRFHENKIFNKEKVQRIKCDLKDYQWYVNSFEKVK